MDPDDYDDEPVVDYDGLVRSRRMIDGAVDEGETEDHASKPVFGVGLAAWIFVAMAVLLMALFVLG